MDKITVLKDNIGDIEEDMLTFFYYSCSISIALLALTAIIFTIYNERITSKVENLVSNFPDKENLDISNDLKEMNNLLISNDVYQLTKIIILFVISSSSLLWIIVLINKLLKSDNWVVTIFLVTSTILVLGSIVGIPWLLFLFNRNKYIKLRKGSFTFKALFDFVNNYKSINKNKFINEIVVPNIRITLNEAMKINITLKKNLKIDKMNMILELRNPGSEYCLIIFGSSKEESIIYDLKSTNAKLADDTYEGLFNLLSNYEINTLHCFEKRDILCSLDLKKESLSNDCFSFETEITNKKSISNEVLKQFKKKNYNSIILKDEQPKYFLTKSNK